LKGVKYISPTGNSGYAEAGKDYIIGLHNYGIPVMYEPLKFDNFGEQETGDRSKVIKSLYRPLDYDTVIVHSTPTNWGEKARANRGKKIIGMTVWETDKVPDNWVKMMNQVHRVVVPCEWNASVFKKCGVTRPISVIPHILKPAPTITCKVSGIEPEDYVFYTIGQWHNRKGIHDAIRSYVEAFKSTDKVALLVKTFASDFSEGQKNEIRRMVGDIVSSYEDVPKVVLVLDELRQEEMEALHNVGDCFFSMCKSEGWGLPAFDAAGRGKPVIMTSYGGQMDFLKKGNHRLINYKMIPVSGMGWIRAYSKDQKWAQPNINQAVTHLRDVFKHRLGINKQQINWMAKEFNPKSVIKKLIKIL